jgi:hypothetical protein
MVNHDGNFKHQSGWRLTYPYEKYESQMGV